MNLTKKKDVTSNVAHNKSVTGYVEESRGGVSIVNQDKKV